MRILARPVRKFAEDRRGMVGMLFPLSFLPMMLFIGAVVDYGRALNAKGAIQRAADAGSLAAASTASSSLEEKAAVATRVFFSNLPAEMGGVTPTVSTPNGTIVISASYAQPTAFMKIAGFDSITVRASATAAAGITAGATANVCLLALSPTSTDGLHIQGTNKVADRNCWAWVNSTAGGSINAVGTATAEGAGFCTAGSVIGASHFTPNPQVGCPTLADPLATMALPTYSGCDFASKVEVKNGAATLNPGVYCGGIDIKPQAIVTFNPGLYVILGGDLNIQGGSTATGTGVTFYFADQDSNLTIQGGANATLSAPTGAAAWAGFLFLQSRDGTTSAHTVIQGGGNVQMTGVLYMPRRIVEVGGNGNVNAESKYFGMIADSFYLIGNGTLYLKADNVAAEMPTVLPKVVSTARLAY